MLPQKLLRPWRLAVGAITGSAKTTLVLPAGRAALSVKEFCAWACISRSTFYNLIAAHEIRVRKIGNRTVVLCSDALAWLQALPELRVEDSLSSPLPDKSSLTKLKHPHHATSQHKKSLVASIVPSARCVAGSLMECCPQ